MSQRVKRQLNKSVDDGTVPAKRRKCRPRSPAEEEESRGPAAAEAKGTPERGGGGGNSNGGEGDGTVWTPRPLNDLKISSIYNRSATEAPAELFRKDLISAMKLPDSEPLSADEYWVITDQWKQEWERGVQVPVNPDSLPEPLVTVTGQHGSGVEGRHPDFRLPKGKYIRITKDEMFNPDDHILSSMPARADKSCAYDLDDCDVEWLRIANGERATMGLQSISEDALERAIEEMEIRCWEKIQTIVRTEEGLGIEYDENVICDVCRSPDSEEGNEMVFCDLCNICVHQACYGITRIPPGSWLCRTCAVNLPRPECVLCPNRGGAMKCTRSGHKWAHVSCALWIPEVSIGCVERMEPITKISSIPQSRWALICVLCRERVGACIQCSVKTCKTAYHVTCAFKYGLEMKAIIEDESADDGVKLKSYCQKHSVTSKKERTGAGASSEDEDSRRKRRKDMTSEEKNQARAAKLQEIEAEFYKHVSTKDVSAHLTQQLGLDAEAITYIYNYWKLKRKAGFNKPLLAPRTEEGDILSRKQEQADKEKMRMFVQLRQDLERVRNLCYMVSRREKLSRSFFRMREQTFHKQVAVLSSHDLSVADSEAILAANHGPSLYDHLYSHGAAVLSHGAEFEAALIRIAGRKRDLQEGKDETVGVTSIAVGGEKRKRKESIARQGPNGVLIPQSTALKPPRTSTPNSGPASPSENPYKRTYINGALSRRRNSLYSMSSGSEAEANSLVRSRKDTSAAETSMTEDEKEVSPKKSTTSIKKNASAVNRTKSKSITSNVASSEDEELGGITANRRRIRKGLTKSRTLRQMEQEMSDDRSASDSDDLLPPGSISSKTGRNTSSAKAQASAVSAGKAGTKVKAAIYSDSDSEVPETRKPSPTRSISSVASSSAESSSDTSGSSSSSESSASSSSSSGASKSGVLVRTKAAVKEFTPGGDKEDELKSEVSDVSKVNESLSKTTQSKKKNLNISKKKKRKESVNNDNAKGRSLSASNKRGKDNLAPSSDLIVPQRQAAKKATESMRFVHSRGGVKDSITLVEDILSEATVINKKTSNQVLDSSSGKKSTEFSSKKGDLVADLSKRSPMGFPDVSKKPNHQGDRKGSNRGKQVLSCKTKDIYDFEKDSNDENIDMDIDCNSKASKNNSSKLKKHGTKTFSSLSGKDSKGAKDIYDFDKNDGDDGSELKESKTGKSKVNRSLSSQKGKPSNKDIFDFTDEADEVKITKKSHKLKASTFLKSKELVAISSKDSSSKDSFESEKEDNLPEVLAYVPQRMAAKKAAETIKSGLLTKPATTTSVDGEAEKDSLLVATAVTETCKSTKSKGGKLYRNKQKSLTHLKKDDINISSAESDKEYEDDEEEENSEVKRKRKIKKDGKKNVENGSEDVKEYSDRRRSFRKIIEVENESVGASVKDEEECGRKGNWPFLDKGSRSDLADISRKKVGSGSEKRSTDDKTKEIGKEKLRSDKRNVDDLFGKDGERRPKFKGGTPDKKLKTSDRRPELGFRPPCNPDTERSGAQDHSSVEDNEANDNRKSKKGPCDRLGDIDVRPGDTPFSIRGSSSAREPTKPRPTRALERRRRSGSTRDGKSDSTPGKRKQEDLESKETGIKKILSLPADCGEPRESVKDSTVIPSRADILNSSSGSSSSSSSSSSSTSSSSSSSSESSSESSPESSPEAPKELSSARRVRTSSKTTQENTQIANATDAMKVDEYLDDKAKNNNSSISEIDTVNKSPSHFIKDETNELAVIEDLKVEETNSMRAERMSLDQLAEKLVEDQLFRKQNEIEEEILSSTNPKNISKRLPVSHTITLSKAPIKSPPKERATGLETPLPMPVQALEDDPCLQTNTVKSDFSLHQNLTEVVKLPPSTETVMDQNAIEFHKIHEMEEINPSLTEKEDEVRIKLGASQRMLGNKGSDNKETEETLEIVSEILPIHDEIVSKRDLLVSDDDVKLIEVKDLDASSSLEEGKASPDQKSVNEHIVVPSETNKVDVSSMDIPDVAEVALAISSNVDKQNLMVEHMSNLAVSQDICPEPNAASLVQSPLPSVPQQQIIFESEEEITRLHQTFMHIQNLHPFHNQTESSTRGNSAGNASHLVPPCSHSSVSTPALQHHQIHRSTSFNQAPLPPSASILPSPHPREDLLFDDFENNVLAVDDTASSEGGFGQHRHQRLSMQPRRSCEEGVIGSNAGGESAHGQSQPLPPPPLTSLQFPFGPVADFLFREDTKEESARETRNLVKKLRQDYAKKSSSGPSSSVGAGTDVEDGEEDGPPENCGESVSESEIVSASHEELQSHIQILPISTSMETISSAPTINHLISTPVVQSVSPTPIPSSSSMPSSISSVPISSSPHPIVMNVSTASSILLPQSVPTPSTSLPHSISPPAKSSEIPPSSMQPSLVSNAISTMVSSPYPITTIPTSFTPVSLPFSTHQTPSIQAFPHSFPVSTSPSCAILQQPVNQTPNVQSSGIRSTSLPEECANISLHVGVIAAPDSYDPLSDLGAVPVGVEKNTCPNNSDVGVNIEPVEKIGYEACVLLDSNALAGSEKMHGNDAEHSDERWVPPGNSCNQLPTIQASDTNLSNTTLASIPPSHLPSDCIFNRAQDAKWADSEVLPVRRSSSSSCASSASSTASSSNSSAGDNGRPDDDEDERPIIPHGELLEQSIQAHSHLSQHHHDQLIPQQHHPDFQTRLQTLPDHIRDSPILPGDVNAIASGVSEGLYTPAPVGGSHQPQAIPSPKYEHRTSCETAFNQPIVSTIFPSMDVPFPLHYPSSSSMPSKIEEQKHTPCGAAFTSSSHNMAFTASIVSPSPSPQPTLPPPPPPIPPLQTTVSQQPFVPLSSPKPPQSPAFPQPICESLPPATPKTFNHSGRTPRRSPAKATRASPRSKAPVISAQVPLVSPPPKPSGRGRRGRGGRGGRRGAKDHGGGGRGNKKNQWNIGPDDGIGTIRAKLVGTVYDFDVEDAEEEEDLENLRAMRERRKSSDVARAMAEARMRDESPRSFRGQTPPSAASRDLVGSLDEDEEDEVIISEGSDTSFLPPPPPPSQQAQSVAPPPQARLAQFPQPLLPGPVDMRTYSVPAVPTFEPPPPPPTPPSSASSSSSTAVPQSTTPPPSSTSSYHNHLLGSYSSSQVPDLMEDLEKELMAEVTPSLSIPPSSNLLPQQQIGAQSMALSPTHKTTCLSESRNQLKVKIKGPFLDANYTSTPVVPVVSSQVQQSTGVIHMQGTPGGAEHHHHHHHQSLGVSVTPSSNLRRMRKKELLRQYWTQDMNMDDGGAAGAVAAVVGGAAPMGAGSSVGPGGMASAAGTTAVTSSVLQPAAAVSRAVITIPKAVASMTSIPTREDYRAVVDMEKKRRKEKSGQIVSRELRNLDPTAFLMSGEEGVGEREGRRRGSSDGVASRRRGRPPKGSPATVAPKLKIKFGGTDIAVTGVGNSGSGGGGSGDERRFRGRPPKKRLSAVAANAAISNAAASAAIHVPTVEELKRESMKYRRKIMADFDEEEKKKSVSQMGNIGNDGSSGIKKKHSRRGSDTSLSIENSSPAVEIVHTERESAPPKLIIRLGKRPSLSIPNKDIANVGISRVEPLVPVPEGASGTVPERPSSRGGGAPPSNSPSLNTAAPACGDSRNSSSGIAPAAAPEVRTSKVVPIRLKLARCEEGYVMKDDGNSGSVEGLVGDSSTENSLRVQVEKKGCEVR